MSDEVNIKENFKVFGYTIEVLAVHERYQFRVSAGETVLVTSRLIYGSPAKAAAGALMWIAEK